MNVEQMSIVEILERARRADILEVVQDCGLNPTSSLLVCCPFHDDRTPSMKIYPESNSSYCFGCHRVYDAIDFVRKFKRKTFAEALRYIVEHYDTEPPEEVTEVGPILPPRTFLVKKVPVRHRPMVQDHLLWLEFLVEQGEMAPLEAAERVHVLVNEFSNGSRHGGGEV